MVAITSMSLLGSQALCRLWPIHTLPYSLKPSPLPPLANMLLLGIQGSGPPGGKILPAHPFPNSQHQFTTSPPLGWAGSG